MASIGATRRKRLGLARESRRNRNEAKLSADNPGSCDPIGGKKRSLREIAAELEAQGPVAASGKAFGAAAISR
jgi:hypothetical protein